MKLIIDIDKEDYKIIKDSTIIGKPNDIRFAIKNGIPLDDIRAEIEEHTDEKYGITALGCGTALKIIDKHMKGDTE